MKIHFYLAHPAHFHLFKNVIYELKSRSHNVSITIKSKDVLPDLLAEENLPYINIAPTVRKDSKLGIIKSLISRSLNHYKICKNIKPDLFISSSAEFAPISKLLHIPYINIFEDDLVLFKNYSNFFGRFVDHMICPSSCNNGKLNKKTIQYSGCQELAYLSPKYFNPDYKKVENIFDKDRQNFLIRFAKLTAWHDSGVTGLTKDITLKIIKMLELKGRVFITSEKEIDSELEKYRISIKPSDMHHVLYFSDMYIGDSQTMTAEAAVLGTPAIRFNDFVRKLGYLEELEFKYDLTYGFKTEEPEKMIAKISELLAIDNLKDMWAIKRERMLNESIDLSTFIAWFLEKYPKSFKILSSDHDYINNFKRK
ncbi:MAG: DUF354 domain-containing protein [Bacteroidota bacterium]|nr:DUF354 domain-containing protein [Bacteroidota bacterium]